MRDEFGPLLRFFRTRAGRSRNSLCREVGCDPSYGTRIEAGERDAPKLAFVEGFARALRLNQHDRNRLLVAAGYAPHEITGVGWSAALQAVADVLSDPFLEDSERDQFAAVVQSIAERWRGGSEPRATTGAAAHANGARGRGG